MQTTDLVQLLHPLTDTPRERGELNNNPCNIDKGVPPVAWLGLSPLYAQRRDARFAVFVSPEYGFRAAAIDMRTHARRTTPFTLKVAIGIWAPPTENDTQRYIENISDWTGLHPDAVINVFNLPTMQAFLTAITREEQGRCIYPPELIEHGLYLAGGWTVLPPNAKV